MRPAPLLLLSSLLLLSALLRPAASRPRSLPGWPDEPDRLRTPEDALLRDGAASELLDELILRSLQRRSPEVLRLLPAGQGEAARPLLKRGDEPPLSIDLTFHLLRNMMHMAKMENQREQELLNRKILDDVGK